MSLLAVCCCLKPFKRDKLWHSSLISFPFLFLLLSFPSSLLFKNGIYILTHSVNQPQVSKMGVPFKNQKIFNEFYTFVIKNETPINYKVLKLFLTKKSKSIVLATKSTRSNFKGSKSKSWNFK